MNLEGLTVAAITLLSVGMISACSVKTEVHQTSYSAPVSRSVTDSSSCWPDSSSSACTEKPSALAHTNAKTTCDGQDCSSQVSLKRKRNDSVIELQYKVALYCAHNRENARMTREVPHRALKFTCN